MDKKTEILAPVGSKQALIAAVRSGADAVYMGAKLFNARIKADNFSDEELKWAIDYCHAHCVKVHITMNTLIYDDEISLALSEIKKVISYGADAVILQDLGFASLVKKLGADIERHASTQMSVQTVKGATLLKDLGYKRVVLPRECSKTEIAKIKDNVDIEIEIFVHGALCMCVSGQCYMSSVFGGRSGNRGLCAQPCRLPFGVGEKEGYNLSLKDLSLIDKYEEIFRLGVHSLKIEGRMKRPEYVAAAVKCLKNAQESQTDEELSSDLKAVFSRSGFTDGYFEAKRGKDMFGIRKKEDVVGATNEVLKNLSALYEKERQTIPVNFYLTVIENEKVSLSASAMGKTCFVSDEYIPEKALNKPLTKEGLEARLSKCGGTQFYPSEIEIELDEGLIVPASVINNLRRMALEELEKKLTTVKAKNFTELDYKVTPHTVKGAAKYHVRVADVRQIPTKLENVENLILPLNIDEKTVENLKNSPIKLVIELPRGIFGAENTLKQRLSRVKELGINTAYCSTIDAVAIAKELGFEIETGFSMNITNSESVAVLEELGVKGITLSPELTLKRISKIGGSVKRGIIAFGRLPLMLTRNCPIANEKTCAECKGQSYLTDRKGMKFPVMCNFGCSEILNSQPIYLGDRLDEIKGVDFITFYFTNENQKLCDAVLDAYRKGKGIKGNNHTRGLYYRGAE